MTRAKIALLVAGFLVFAALAIGALQNLWRHSDVPGGVALGLGVVWSFCALGFLAELVRVLR